MKAIEFCHPSFFFRRSDARPVIVSSGPPHHPSRFASPPTDCLIASLCRCCLYLASVPTTDALTNVVKAAVNNVGWSMFIARTGLSPCKRDVDVEVRPNRLGNGLYAMRAFEPGDLIERYTGQLMSGSSFEAGDSDGHYAMILSSGDVVDGADPERSNFVRYINHSVRKANCKTEDMVDTLTGAVAVYVTVEKPIRPGDELFMDYGVQYWDSMGLARLSPQRLMVDYL